MKILTYKILGFFSSYNPKTKAVERQESVAEVVAECPTKAVFDASYQIAEKEAIPGTVAVSGEFDPESAPVDESALWEELDGAYQAGYAEGYSEGVNGVYGNQ